LKYQLVSGLISIKTLQGMAISAFSRIYIAGMPILHKVGLY